MIKGNNIEKEQDNLFRPFYLAFFASLIALIFSSFFFPSAIEMGTSALISISMAHFMQEFLEHNRYLIWEKKESPIKANFLLTKQITAVFLGILCSSAFLQTNFLGFTEVEEVYKNGFADLLFHNFQILIGGTIFALLYRSGGLVVILAWNALHWSKAISSYALQISADQGYLKAGLVIASIMPHLTLEVVAYVIAGMSGVFLSKALTKYKASSAEFYRVSNACLALLVTALVVLFLSVACEIYLAQQIFHSLR